MFRSVSIMLLLAGVALAPLAAGAQEQEEKQEAYSYATYFECEVSGQWLVDEIAESVYAPIYDAAVEDGTISGWGWLAHHTGGKWRRILYRSASSLDALLDAGDTIQDRVNDENAPAARQVGRVCDAHDDYIWKSEAGGTADTGRGAAGFSIYLICDMAKEDRADEIVQNVFAPVYDRHVAEGDLDSWGWLSHVVGGKWRRLVTLTAADHKTLLKARAAVFQELSEKHDAETTEFNAICSAHQDYMWDIQLETP